MAEISSGSNSSTDLSSAEECVEQAASSFASYFDIEPKKQRQQLGEEIEEMLTKLDEFCAVVDMDCHPDQSTDETQQGPSTQGCHSFQFADDCQPGPSSQKIQPVLSSYTPKAEPYPVKLECHNSSEDCWYPNESFSTARPKRKSLMAHPERRSSIHHEPDLSSEEVESDLLSDDRSPTETLSEAHPRNSKEKDNSKPLEIMQQHSRSPKHPKAKRQKLTSQEVSNPSLDSQAMSKNEPRPPKQETYKKPYRYCIFCGKMASKLSAHILIKHYENPRVQNAAKLPYKERIQEFMKMRKEGILQQNKLEAKKCNPVYKRERSSKNTESVPVMCSICNGFFEKSYIKRHTIRCRRDADTAVHGVDIPASFLQNDNLMAKESEFVTEDMTRFRQSESSQLCRTDPVLLKSGKSIWNDKRKQSKSCDSSDNRRYPTRSSLVKYEPDLSSDEVDSDLRSNDSWNPSPEEIFSVIDLNNSEEDDIKPLKIKQQPSKPPTAIRQKLTSPDAAGISNPSLDSQAMLKNKPRQPKQETYKKPYRYCIFCGKMSSKLSDHLMKRHHHNPRVQNAVKLPKKERIREFMKIKKEGILHQNKLEAKKCNPVYKRERLSKKTESVPVMCSICNGFFAERYIEKHTNKCRKNAETAVHGADIPASFLQNDDLIAKESGFVSDLSTLCKSKGSQLCTTDPVLEIEKELWKKEQKKQNQFCNSSDNRRYPTRSSSVKYEPDLSSDEVESDLRSDDGWNPSPEETFSETDLDNSEENYIRPLKIKQEHSKHPKHPTAKRLKLTSPDDAGVRNPSQDSQAVSENEPRQSKQESYKKPYRYCIFCGKMASKLSDHLIKQHHDNPRVQNAVKLPKKERIQEFNKIRKEGILHQNKLEAKKCNPVYKRERLSKKTESVLVMCSICNGFLEKSYIKKHIRKCRKNAETAVH